MFAEILISVHCSWHLTMTPDKLPTLWKISHGYTGTHLLFPFQTPRPTSVDANYSNLQHEKQLDIQLDEGIVFSSAAWDWEGGGNPCYWQLKASLAFVTINYKTGKDRRMEGKK